MIRTYGTSLLYSRVCTHTKTVLNLHDAPEVLLYRQARSAGVGAERAVLIGPVRVPYWSKMRHRGTMSAVESLGRHNACVRKRRQLYEGVIAI